MRMDWVKKVSLGVCGGVLLGGLVGESFAATPQMEKLGRGLTVANNGTGTFVSAISLLNMAAEQQLWHALQPL